MQWSPQQDKALSMVSEWMRVPEPQTFYLAGFAGTGKTTLAKYLAEDYDTLFAAYTGKAALVMKKSGIPGASTIHSILYRYVPPSSRKIEELEKKVAVNPTPALIAELKKLKQPRFELREDSPIADVDLLVLDECSMIDEEMAKDILSFDVKVLVLGDPMQLPPVKGTGYFTSRRPNITLTEIHRQALDNPIIALSQRVREGGDIPVNFSDKARRLPRGSFVPEMARDASQIITGKNVTRQLWNAKMRAALGFKERYPVLGDKIICLRNNHELGIFNGMFATVENSPSQTPNSFAISLDIKTELDGYIEGVNVLSGIFDGTDEAVPYWRQKELDQFDYGYCITVHKAQGSQFDNVLFVDDGFLAWDRPNRTRWLYTAVTRAVDSITVV